MENWSPEQVDAALKAGEIILVDVREPGEYENERIPGALLLPLSTFEKPRLRRKSVRSSSLRATMRSRAAQMPSTNG